ncbi:MAG: phosphatidylserine decarboxylase family protein [Myxococcales bacterium]|nr:phosphatidylserine decarboxylase family protein [Myxococcales bacterium]|tara:strand:+ start:1861 stop:2505 length:645 start_codon:yes stop_codon:yes gene_type:complete
MNSPVIAREGWSRIALILVAAIAIHYWAGVAWASPVWILLVLVVQFFRDPRRSIPQQSGVVVSPAHGKVVSIETTRDPYLAREAVKVSIFMNIFSVHSNRTPVDGIVVERWYNKGKFFNAALDKASAFNERSAIHIRTPAGWDVTSVQIAGLVARRILSYLTVGQSVERGERYGFIRFGSRVDVYLPEGSRIVARLGKWVNSGSDIIAFLPDSD